MRAIFVTYNYGHIILQHFDISPNFSFAASETEYDYQ